MNTTEWLLSDSNPSVKYWTLKDLLDKPANDKEVLATQKKIEEQDVVKRIFSFQNDQGVWGNPRRLWGYQNTCFQLILLSELGYERDPRIERAVESIFAFQAEDGSFPYVLGRKKRRKTNDFCLTGMILKFLLLFKYDDSRVREALTFLLSTEENGWACGYYPQQSEKVFPQKCYMGGIKVLSAFAKLPRSLVSTEVEDVIARNAEIYLENRIYWYRKDEKGTRVVKPSWEKFTFPMYWQSDALEVLDVLTELKIKDERMHEALELVKSKEVNGKWLLERTFLKDAFVQLEEVGTPSKWVTLRALRVLKRAGK